jgi:hypothetical protein
MISSRPTSYAEYYHRAYAILDELTPLRTDCGVVCGKACCQGDETQGMRLFPHERTVLPVTDTEDGGKLAVCAGNCCRADRPLACRIFPLFPYIHDDGHISVETDLRAYRLCPLATHPEAVRFDPQFVRAVRQVGRLLAQDPEIRAYMKEVSAEIDIFRQFYNKHGRPSARIRRG